MRIGFTTRRHASRCLSALSKRFHEAVWPPKAAESSRKPLIRGKEVEAQGLDDLESSGIANAITPFLL